MDYKLFRFSIEQELGQVDNDQWESFEVVKECVELYIEKEYRNIEMCATKLLSRFTCFASFRCYLEVADLVKVPRANRISPRGITLQLSSVLGSDILVGQPCKQCRDGDSRQHYPKPATMF